MLPSAWTKFKHHKVQRELWTTSSRFVAVPAGRGSGKTELAKRRLVRYLPVKKEWSDPRYFYGAPTEGQAKRIAWEHIKALVPKSWVKDTVGLRIRTVFGSELWVVGLDKPQRIEGVQWDGCVIDESCDIKPQTFDLNILPALSWRHGWCWRIGVPKRQGIGAAEYRMYYENAVAGKLEDTVGYTWPSSDIIPKDALRAAQRIMDPKDYEEQFEAHFVKAGGGIFYAFDEDMNVRPCAYDNKLPLVIGSDFNVDPMAWVIGHIYENRIEWIDEIWLRDTNTPRTLTVLRERYQHHKGGFEFYGDATGRARKTSASESDYKQIANDERFKQLGRTIHYPKGNPSIDDRFAACNAMIHNAAGERRMFIDPRCKRLIQDLRARYYKPGTKEVADTGDLGHITDAMGYVVFKRFPIRVKLPSMKQEVYIHGR